MSRRDDHRHNQPQGIDKICRLRPLIVQAQGSNPRLQAGRFHHRYSEPLQ
jgi:hypothetical protein